MSQGLVNMEPLLFYLLLTAYFIAMMLYWVSAVSKKDNLSHLATACTVFGLLINTATLGVRMLIAHRAPLANGYEFLLTFCWGIAAVYLVAEFRYRLRALGSFVLPVPAMLLLFVEIAISPVERSATVIMPALKSQWLTIHVITAMLAYGAFAVSCGLGMMYLLKLGKTNERKDYKEFISHLPSLEVLDELAYKVVAFGFPLLTLCIITGAVWANYTWGSYWSWDPKETWSLITWLVYAGYLHARFTHEWRGKRAAWLAVFGFIAVLFTFFGVNYLLPGLHSYATSGAI